MLRDGRYRLAFIQRVITVRRFDSRKSDLVIGGEAQRTQDAVAVGSGESFVVVGEQDGSVLEVGESKENLFDAGSGDAVVAGDSDASKSGTNRSCCGEMQPSLGMQLKSQLVAGDCRRSEDPNCTLKPP